MQLISTSGYSAVTSQPVSMHNRIRYSSASFLRKVLKPDGTIAAIEQEEEEAEG
jgi:hypothetical protein